MITSHSDMKKMIKDEVHEVNLSTLEFKSLLMDLMELVFHVWKFS